MQTAQSLLDKHYTQLGYAYVWLYFSTMCMLQLSCSGSSAAASCNA
jgi:hypothetical protein